MAGKGGGAWKVAYADFVTAMMAFFLVMWIVAQNKPVKEAVAGYFKNPSSGLLSGKTNSLLPMKEGGPSPFSQNPLSLKHGSSKSPTMAAPAEDAATSTAVKSGRIALNTQDNSTVGGQALFLEESAELDQTAQHTLDEIVPVLLGKFNKIEVRGHASGRRPSSGSPYKDGWELSYARSVAVMKYLVEKGVDQRRIRLSQSAGNDPSRNTTNSGGRIGAARVEVIVLSEVVASSTHAEDARGDRAKNPRKKLAREKPARDKAAKPAGKKAPKSPKSAEREEPLK